MNISINISGLYDAIFDDALAMEIIGRDIETELQILKEKEQAGQLTPYEECCMSIPVSWGNKP